MHPVIRADGTQYTPDQPNPAGRRVKYPMRFLEPGDSFEVDYDAMRSLNVMISTAKQHGRKHEIHRTSKPGILRIERIV